jgi:carbonic anhydrase
VQLLFRLAHCRIKIEKAEPSGRWHVRVSGSLSFMTVPKLTEALGGIPPGAYVDVDLQVSFVDHAALEALHGWRQSHERNGGRVDIDQSHDRIGPRTSTA